MEIVERKIKDLIHAEYNPRKLSPDQHKQLQDSLTRFGVVDPVIVNKHPERENIIVGGHQRSKVWQELGNKTIPTVEVNLTPEKERELNVRLNKNSGEFDFELLQEHFDTTELVEWGFGDDELNFFEADDSEAQEDDYEIPNEIKTDIVLGDLIEIGQHRLLCGDSTDSDAVANLMNGEKADIAFTSPPYNVGGSVDNKKGNKKMYIDSDDNLENYNDFLQQSLNTSFIYSNYSFYNLQLLSNNMLDIVSWLGNNATYVKDILIWNKKNCPPNIVKGAFNTKYEFIFCFDSNHKNGRNFPCKWQGKYNNVIDLESNLNNQETDYHRAGFPVSFPSWMIEKMDFSKSVLDLFCGTGTTMVAAHQLQRKCYGMELDPKYCQVIVDRMMKLDDTLTVKINGKEYLQLESA